MKAIVIETPGDAGGLRLTSVHDPIPKDDELLVRVHATALNRTDILQRMGGYPARRGDSDILGLELAGEVVDVGAAVTQFTAGDRIYGLSGAGGYAQLDTIHESLAMPMPMELNFQQAASIPEVFFTASTALRTLGNLQEGERALIHAGGGGVGIAAIQIAKLLKAEAWVTCGSDDKCKKAGDLGADVTINYQEQDFADDVKQRTDGEGVHVILDVVSANYWARNLASLATARRMVLVAMLSGVKTDVNLGQILGRRLQIFGTVMRSRPLADRAAITRDYSDMLEPAIVAGKIKPVIDKVFPLREAAETHRYMEANQNFGKIVLDVANGV